MVPDKVGEPIRAYRMWRIASNRRTPRRYTSSIPNADFGSLLPLNAIKQTWTDRESLTARCQAWDEDRQQHFDHPAPEPNCRCGIYGFKELAWLDEPILLLLAERLNEYAQRNARGHRFGRSQEHWLAVGSVLLWGRVIEGQYGYRAGHAYPERLWLLPPARIGGKDKTALDEATVDLAADLLVVLRHRYGVPVGYADHDLNVSQLARTEETGWFFSWRLTASGGDRLADALAERGAPTVALPTVKDALELWLAHQSDGGSSNDRHLVRRYLTPVFGHIQIDRPEEIERVVYAPISMSTHSPYAPRTICRHRKVIADALALARDRWLLGRDGANPFDSD
jgi:hypothetical protein